MTTDRQDGAKEAARKARELRLAAALRANLRRRKAAAQTGEESAQSPPSEPSAEARSTDE